MYGSPYTYSGSPMTPCSCWFVPIAPSDPSAQKTHLPQVDLQAHTTILSTLSRTRLKQIFVNNTSQDIKEAFYTFPLYDGVSIVSFRCRIGEKVIIGVVKEKSEAKADYTDAVARGEAAALLEQWDNASDVFKTSLGNLPKDSQAEVEIEYIGELRQDAESDGVRFTIPTFIVPRYGALNLPTSLFGYDASHGKKIEILVDVEVEQGAQIEALSSPSHPISMTLGKTSTQKTTFQSNLASASLSLGSAELEKDFVIVVRAQGHEIPRALLEKHSSIPNHRALMTTLVPKFNLPNIHPEIVFVVDRSGSMSGKISLVVEALVVFLKSLPLSAKFNICSFGSSFSFLFPKSKPYDEKSLQKALKDVKGFGANYGGTEMLRPIQEVVQNRLPGVPLEIMVLTDGAISYQQQLFDFVNEASKSNVRLFSLGIGSGASSSLVEGLARAGSGFAQFADDGEKIDKRVVRMLKAALCPHITDYRMEIQYDTKSQQAKDSLTDNDYEMVETDSETPKATESRSTMNATPISLVDPNFAEIPTNNSTSKYDHLPSISIPEELQVPHDLPPLYSFNRTTAFILLPNTEGQIKSVVLSATCDQGPLRLEIPVHDVGIGETVHHLAAKKAMLEIEEGRGWLNSAKSDDGQSLKSKYGADWERMVEREAVRIGVQFQIAGKFCSFVAIEKMSQEGNEVRSLNEMGPPPYHPQSYPSPREYRCSEVSMQSDPAGAVSFSGRDRDCYRRRESVGLQQLACAPANAGQFRNSILPSSDNRISGYPGASFFGSIGSGFKKSPAQPRKSSTQESTSSTPFGSSSTGSGTGSSLFGNSSGRGFFGGNATTGHHNTAPSVPPWRKQAMPPVSSSRKQKRMSSFAATPQGPSPGEAAFDCEDESHRNESETTYGPMTTEAKVHTIIGLQGFDGSWNALSTLMETAEVKKFDFTRSSLPSQNDSVKATLLALAWLEYEAGKQREIWEMVADKAKSWLTQTCGISNVDAMVKQVMQDLFERHL